MTTISHRIGAEVRNEAHRAAVGDFSRLALIKMIAKNGSEAAPMLQRSTPRVQRMMDGYRDIRFHFEDAQKALAAPTGNAMVATHVPQQDLTSMTLQDVLLASKAAVSPLSTVNSTAIADFTAASGAFLESVGSYGWFDAVYPFMRPIPLMSDVVSVTASGTINSVNSLGGTVYETALKKIGSLSMASTRVDPIKVASLIAMSNELARFAAERGTAVFRGELAKATAASTDAEAISRVSAGAATSASTGTTMSAFRDDLRWLLQQVDVDAASKLFLIMSASTAKNLALLEDDELMKDFGVQGGSIAGIQVAISDAAANSLILIDANQLAGDRGLALPTQSNESTIQLSDSPDSPATASTTLISLWQTNMVALRIERFFGVKRLRTSAAAAITGVSYGGANSPA